MTPTYRVVRFHRDEEHPEHRRVIASGLSLAEAQAHCQNDGTHGYDERGDVVWFDGYTAELDDAMSRVMAEMESDPYVTHPSNRSATPEEER